MSVNDINEQIKAMRDYTSELGDIKNKVSDKLFEQISTYDMKQGKAFMDRLLSMSDAELKAYTKAYDEKLSLADQLSKSLYKNDLDKVAGEYDKAINAAFSNLPKELQTLGKQTMQGFLKGLGTNQADITSAVKNIINGMIGTFKKELGIHSPSKVTMKLGAFTGEGFADGLKDMIKTVKKAAEDIADTVTDTLDFGDLGDVKTLASVPTSNGLNRQNGANNAPTTQVINFNQTNNSPKALDRLTIYRQTNNMLFGAKVRLNNV